MSTAEELAAEVETLRRQVQVLADREEIRNLTKEYAKRLDARDLHAFSLLFAKEGTWTGGTGSGTGPEGIQSMLEKGLANNATPSGGRILYHLTTDPQIEVDGDEATGSCFWMHCRRDDADRPTLPTLGHYDDRYVREDGHWRFAERRVSQLMATRS